MAIAPGDRLPDANFLQMGPDGPESVALKPLTSGRKVVIFGLPGAYTGVCSTAHVPSFIRSMDKLKAGGVAGVYCVTVNDPHVTRAWGEVTGATAAGIRILADADGSFTKSIGMDFDRPSAGFIGRSKRYSMLVEDGVVSRFNLEEQAGVCALSSGEAMVEQLED